jgi:hypothetical protein
MLVTWTDFHDLRFVKRTKFKPWTGFDLEHIYYMNEIQLWTVSALNGFHLWTNLKMNAFPHWTFLENKTVSHLKRFATSTNAFLWISMMNKLWIMNGFRLRTNFKWTFSAFEQIWKWTHFHLEHFLKINGFPPQTFCNFKQMRSYGFPWWTNCESWTDSVSEQILKRTVSAFEQIWKWTHFHLEHFKKINGFPPQTVCNFNKCVPMDFRDEQIANHERIPSPNKF